MIFQGEMNIFHIVSYKSLGFGARVGVDYMQM